MRRVFTLALAALLASAGVAQDPKPKGDGARAAYEAMVGDLEKARQRFDSAFAALRESDAWKSAQEAKDRGKLQAMYEELESVDLADFILRAQDHAEEFGGDDAVAFQCWIATHAQEAGDVKAAIAEVEGQLTSERLIQIAESGHVAWRFLGEDEGVAWLDKLASTNQNTMIRAWALYWKAYPVMNGRGDEPAADKKAAAEQDLATAEKLAAGTSLADMIAAPRFEKERLQVGMTVPEIEGVDTDGVAFKLSDYRGKVVLLDFWGFW